MEDPEHLDSFFDKTPLLLGRRRTFMQRGRSTEPRLELVTIPNQVDTIISLSSRRRQSTSQFCQRRQQEASKDAEKCSNCNQVIYRANKHYAHFSGAQEDQEYLEWSNRDRKQKYFLGSSGQWNDRSRYLPHYCKFVHQKLLHQRDSSQEQDSSDGPGHSTTSFRHGLMQYHIGNKRQHTISKWNHAPTDLTSTEDKDGQENCSSGSLATTCPSVSGSVDQVTVSFKNANDFMNSRTTCAEDSSFCLSITQDKDNDKDIPDNYKLRTSEQSPKGSLGADNLTETSKKKKRKECVKKTRRSSSSIPQKKEDGSESLLETQETALVNTPHLENSAESQKINETTCNLKIPDLPEVGVRASHTAAHRRRSSKHMISAVVPAPKTVQEKACTVEKVNNFYDFGNLTSHIKDPEVEADNHVVGTCHNDIHVMTATQTCRFKLPVDVRSLETMSPQEYLRNHCVLSPQNKQLGMKVFQRYRDRRFRIQGKVHLLKALHELLVTFVSIEQWEQICALLDVKEDTAIDSELFGVIAAAVERLMSSAVWNPEVVLQREDVTKETVESADFYSLKRKLGQLHINQQLQTLLVSL